MFILNYILFKYTFINKLLIYRQIQFTLIIKTDNMIFLLLNLNINNNVAVR